ncbi:NAD(+)/NADH kinase [Halodesulfurarchaeum sp.]|uniref:NAD(+)/NADH kinase n=1 Tax=Halodesulfurarchaeum sp. TaxID=1980530 RepID=UPI001BBDC4F8|nr:NAD(+)/NADH kinase [Halodesulfurarchaeum sp.]
MIVGIVAQRDNNRAIELAASVAERLAGPQTDVHGDPRTASDIDVAECDVQSMDECDLVVSIGGDGTFLFAAKGAGSTPIIGVNLGEVGFLNTVTPEHAIETIEGEAVQYRETGTISHREVPRVRLSGSDWGLSPALNEVLVQGHRRGHADGLNLEIRVDGSVYDSTRADGVLVATPTGSTAYNLSEEGPLVHPQIDGFVINIMAGRKAMPPLIVSEDADIEIAISGAAAAVVSSDGSEHRTITPPTEVTVTAAEPAKVAGPGTAFFEALGKLE